MKTSGLKFLPGFIRVRLETSRTLQKILANAGWLFSDQVLRMGLGLFVGVWVARYLGPEKFGTYNYGFAFVALFGVLATLGLDGIAIRDLVRLPSSRDEILGTAFVLKLGGGFLTLGLTLTVISILRPQDSLIRWLVAIFAATTVFQAVDVIDFWFKSQVQSRYTVWAKNSAYSLVVLVKVALILGKAPLIAFAWAVLAEVALWALGLVFVYRLKGYSLRLWSFRPRLARDLLSNSWPLIFSSFMITIYMRIDQVMLGQMKGVEAVGIYSAAVRLSEVWYFIPMIIASSVFPSLIQSKELGEVIYAQRLQKYFHLNTLLAYGLALPTSLLSPFIVSFLYGDSYQGAEKIFFILIWASPIVFLGVAREQYLLNEGLVKFSLLATTIGATSNILLNLVLIPRFSGFGAAIATLISYSLSNYLSSFLLKSPLRIGWMQTNSLINPFSLLWTPRNNL